MSDKLFAREEVLEFFPSMLVYSTSPDNYAIADYDPEYDDPFDISCRTMLLQFERNGKIKNFDIIQNMFFSYQEVENEEDDFY